MGVLQGDQGWLDHKSLSLDSKLPLQIPGSCLNRFEFHQKPREIGAFFGPHAPGPAGLNCLIITELSFKHRPLTHGYSSHRTTRPNQGPPSPGRWRAGHRQDLARCPRNRKYPPAHSTALQWTQRGPIGHQHPTGSSATPEGLGAGIRFGLASHLELGDTKSGLYGTNWSRWHRSIPA
jgi:hypothetical protein